jgi:hypothetical protein
MRSGLTIFFLVAAGCLPDFPIDRSLSVDGGGGSAASDGGSTASDGGGGSTASDGGGSTASDGGGSTSSNCIALAAANGDGHHNPGQACLACHDGTTATKWTAAGTLYSAVSGGAAVAGATIALTDATGATVQIVSGTNGNFYTQTALSYPVTARASGCPADVSMVSKSQTGDCNSCHGAQLQVHLP